VRAFGVRDASGAPQYAIMIFREADELGRSDAQREVADRHAELDREAQRTTALLDALYGAAPVGLGFWNRDLRFVRVNERLAEINGRPAADHVGRTFAEVVPQLAPLLEPMVRRVLERGEPVIAFELTASSPSRPDVPRHWLVSYYPVFAADGESLGVGGVVEEITQIRRAEQRRALQLAVTEVLTIADATADTVPRVLETICATLDWDIACYWSTDPDQPPVTWARPGRRFDGFIASTRRAALSSTTFAGGVAGSGKAEWLDDLHPASFGRASVAYAEGLKSGVAFPVVVEGQVLGVLEAFSAARREEDPDLMQTLIGIGAQLGQFLRRRRAEEERQQLLQRERIARAEAEAAASTLRKLGRVSEAALERSSLNDLLRSLLARIVEVLEADTAAILLLEEDGLLHVRATVGLDDEVERAPAVPMGAGMAGRVAELRTPLLAPDLSQVELVSPVLRDRGINSLVAIPLIVDDRVIGVLHAGSVAFAQFVEDDARLLELIGDRIAMAINQAALYDAEQVAQNRLQFLGEASMLLASSLDVGATLKRVARLAVPHFTDWCSVDLLEAGGAIKRVAVEHVDPRKLELARRLIAASPPSIEDEFGVGAVIRTGEPVLSEEADESALRAAFGNRPGYLDTLLSFDLTSTIIVPLIARDRTLGALTFVSTESERRYRAADLLFAQELAARAAVAVDNAHLYSAAERRRDRLAFLAEASALLGSSLDVDRTLERLGDLLAESFADWVAIHLARADGPPQLVTISDGEREQKPPAAGHLRAREQPPPLVARVLASGESARWPPSAGGESPGAVERERGLHSGLIVPLIARSRILGTLSLARGEGAEPYDDDDVEFAEDMAHRAAIAIDNAQLYREAEERAQAARVLASVGDGVFFVDRNGVVRTWNGAAATATGLALPDVVDRPAVEAIPGWMEIVTRVPIVAAGSAAPRAESLPLDLGGRELWLSIHGVVVPDGIVYAFRDQTEERALETMRTEFVSTVSHELRTPLAAIYGAAMTLRRKDVALNEGQRASLLDVVSGEADRLARTVNDILWASRLDTDTLHVTIENCDPVELARDVVDAQLTHLDLAHELVLSAGPDLPAVAGDPDKVARVLINLIDNALKYSPDGGRVEVTVHLVGSHVRFSVADAGLGVPAAEQRRIFEKFYRLDPNMNRGVGGTGLGLYICRELVRRMEGRIWVDSDGVGSGSTFHVELPVAGDFTARYA
jgi:PAS domain S-box-containing protein